jgi:hypothetical protein
MRTFEISNHAVDERVHIVRGFGARAVRNSSQQSRELVFVHGLNYASRLERRNKFVSSIRPKRF